MDYGDYSGDGSVPKPWWSITNREFQRNYSFLHFLQAPDSFYYYPAYMCHIVRSGLEDDQVFGSYLQTLIKENHLDMLSTDCQEVLTSFLQHCRDFYSEEGLEDDPYIDLIDQVIRKLGSNRDVR